MTSASNCDKEPESSTLRIDSELALGTALVADTVSIREQEQGRRVQTVDRLLKFSKEVDDMYRELIGAATAEGVGRDEVQTMLISGWNSGRIPRVVPGERTRGDGFSLNVLHGIVPDSMFSMFDTSRFAGVELSESGAPNGNLCLVDASDDVVLAEEYVYDSRNPDAFYVASYGFPSPRSDRFDVSKVSQQLSELEPTMIPIE